MKKTLLISIVMASASMILPACNKPKPPESVEVGGVKLDLPKFQQAFSTSTEFMDNVTKVADGIRYQQYGAVLNQLQTLANNPSLTEPQKKAVADLTEQVKQLMAKPSAP